ncbi:MAG TPA: hypothetical protein VFI28_09630 [Candidatus Limnocylindrales bacterium]|nr:hypothetical protein [Candidatus Limnocylindrales bacterium]
MADARNDQLGELAADAALERGDFLVQATDQLRRFLESNRARISDLGGMTLIDEEPEYLSIAPDLTFRSRSRYLDEDTGEWQSETEVIETAAELVELYNPADLYQWFAEAAREAAGLHAEPTATDDVLDAAGISPAETVDLDSTNALDDPYAGAADQWAAAQGPLATPADDTEAARALYDLTLSYLERSQRAEARILEQFEVAARPVAPVLGDFMITDDDDERFVLQADGTLRAEVVPEDAADTWRTLEDPAALVEYYDPTDVFSDLADALAEAYPEIAPESEPGAGGDDVGDEEADGPSEDDDLDDPVDGGDGRNGAGT